VNGHKEPPLSAAQPALHREMRSTEYFTLAFGCIIGVGWMVVIEEWLTAGGPGGAMLAYLVGGLALVPVALAYGRLAQRMPGAASEVAYTGAVFPPVVSFLTGWAMTLAYLVVCPYEAVAIGRLVAYVFPALNSVPLYVVNGYTVYLPHLVLGIALTAVITVINYRGIRLSATFQNWTTFGLLAIFCVFVPLGCWRGSVAQMQPLFSEGPGWTGALVATLAVLPIVPYFLTGFETIPKCSEEAAAGFDTRRFGRMMLLALAVGTFFYVAVIAVVAMLYPWQDLKAKDFGTAIAFRQAFGSEWLVRLLIFGAALSLVKVFNGMFLASTRLLYAMGRRDLLGGGLGAVHANLGTPTVAITLVGGITVLAALLGRAVLVPISEVGSLACTLGWLATCLALTCGAGGKPTWRVRALGLAGAAVSLALAVVAARTFAWYHWVAVAAWGGLGLLLWVARRRMRVDTTASGPGESKLR
jgi:amino acid transporter